MQTEKTQPTLEEIIDAVVKAKRSFGITLQEMHDDVVRAAQALHDAHPELFDTDDSQKECD